MISPTHRPPHVPTVDHGNLEYAGLDNKTPQKYMQTIINQGVFNCLCIRLLFERIDA